MSILRQDRHEQESKSRIDDQSNDQKELMALCQYIKVDEVREKYGYFKKSNETDMGTSEMKNNKDEKQRNDLGKLEYNKDQDLKKYSWFPQKYCLQNKKEAILKIKKPSSQEKIPSEHKQRTELHKKINIFNLSDINKLPVIKFTSKREPRSLEKCSQDSLHFLNTFSCMKQEPISLIITQRGDYSAYISTIQTKSMAYRIFRKIQLNSTISCIFYIEDMRNKDGNHQLMDSEKQISDKLLIGCQNGCIYVIDKFSHVFDTLTDIQYGQQAVIDTNDIQTEDRCVNQIIVDSKNKSRIYVIIQNNLIKRYDYQLVKVNQRVNKDQLQQHQHILKKKKEYRFVEFDPNIKINTQNKIACLKYVKIRQKVINKDICQQICLLVHLEGMHMPCLLNYQDIDIWFPYRLDRLLIRHNNTLQDIFGVKSVEQNTGSSNKLSQQMITGIQIVKYEVNSGKIIIGCTDGSIYFCSVKPISQILKQKVKLNRRYNQEENKLELRLRQQINKYNFISFLIVRDYGFKEGSSIYSIDTMQNQSYIGIATDTKVLFYDIKQKTKFSKTLIQKPKTPINNVIWTQSDQLILSSTKQPANRVYLYSNELPIRNSDLN